MLKKLEKNISHPDLGNIKIKKRAGSRNIRISVRSRSGITITIPWYVPYSSAIKFAEKNKEWILKRIEISSADSQQIDLAKMRKEAKEYLPERLKILSEIHGFTFNRVAIKNNVSNWGSCSAKNNINLNLQLMRLPKDLADFVMLHELCHLKYRNHGKEFHALLDSICGGKEKEYRRNLRTWKIV